MKEKPLISFSSAEIRNRMLRLITV